MAVGRFPPRVVPLGARGVLVVGNDDCGPGVITLAFDCRSQVRDDSVVTETWDPASGQWSTVESLPKPRAAFAAVALADGRVLVTGGVNPGVTDEFGYHRKYQSYSSTYVYETGEGWTKVALLGSARTDPIAAALPDGRVLVAGGYYLSGSTSRIDGDPAAALVAYRPSPKTETTPLTAIFADADPGPPPVAALATAEVYDPDEDRWTATGSMRYARSGAAAVTLADGRVLVVGSSLVHQEGWNDRGVYVDERALETSEVYDPRTGRFSLAGDIPAADLGLLLELGLSNAVDQVEAPGTLVALADGGALLVGRTSTWYADPFPTVGTLVRTLRFDPLTGSWTEVDRRLDLRQTRTDYQYVEVLPGHAEHGAVAVTLADGRVLVAGGERRTCRGDAGCGETFVTLASASLYDPASDTWTVLPPMPEPRAGGAATRLADGSVLIVGGYDSSYSVLATAVRFELGS